MAENCFPIRCSGRSSNRPKKTHAENFSRLTSSTCCHCRPPIDLIGVAAIEIAQRHFRVNPFGTAIRSKSASHRTSR
jgi:hypothetical protein